MYVNCVLAPENYAIVRDGLRAGRVQTNDHHTFTAIMPISYWPQVACRMTLAGV